MELNWKLSDITVFDSIVFCCFYLSNSFVYFCTMMNQRDTICAIATGGQAGAIAVLRVSGPEAITITSKCFRPSVQTKTLANCKGGTVVFGRIMDGSEIVDEVLISVFRAPRSFTGEETIEIACHGSVYLQQRILELLLKMGARLALPGEFTQRAFLNGKMDLSQAEAVADLIGASSKASHRIAMHQMRGGFAGELTLLHDEMVKISALLELELDFSEEDVEFADRTLLLDIATRIRHKVQSLSQSFKVGNAIKNGIPVVIAGETNVGKSTLLNALLKEERALVSDIHGTTRDTVEDTITLGGIHFRFIDTAGLRNTVDVVEQMGIDRTRSKLGMAEIALAVAEITLPLEVILAKVQEIKNHSAEASVVCILNKADKLSDDDVQARVEIVKQKLDLPVVAISAKFFIGIDELESLLVKVSGAADVGENTLVVSNLRHYEALVKAGDAIDRVISGLNQGITADFIAMDIRQCQHYLGEITGTFTNHEILGYIFKNFCIGK